MDKEIVNKMVKRYSSWTPVVWPCREATYCLPKTFAGDHTLARLSMGLRLNARTTVYRVPFRIYFIIIRVKQHILFVIIIIIYLLLLVVYDILIVKNHRNKTILQINLKRGANRTDWYLD